MTLLKPHYPSPAELARQRRMFVLDSATDRPHHYLARALVMRGRDALDIGRHGTSFMRDARSWDKGNDISLHPSRAAERIMRYYRTEAPFSLNQEQAAKAADQWQEALLMGPRLRAWVACNFYLAQSDPPRKCEHPADHMTGAW